MLTKNRMKKENFNTTDLKKQLNKSLMNKLDSLRIELRTEIKNNTSQWFLLLCFLPDYLESLYFCF